MTIADIACYSASSRMRFMSHTGNWSATKQRLHPQSVAEISRHSVLSGDRIRQCEKLSGSRHDSLDDNFLVQHITTPTRGNAILDLVITDEADMISDIEDIGKLQSRP